ncbi:MAG: hypothetical protein IJH32_01320 [Ruminococcus sp.]|nr:hypothetical protein [Ruminococcus sp.]
MSEKNNIPAAEAVPAAPETEPETKKKGRKRKKKQEEEYTNPNNRKFVVSTIVILAILLLIGGFMATFCFVGNTWFAKTDIGDPTAGATYSEEERTQGAEAVVKFFQKNQAGSILQEVSFSDTFCERTGMMSFEGRFYAMFSNIKSIKDDVPGTVYKNWHWDLEKNPETGEFEVVQYGVLKDMTVVGQEDVEETEAPEE